MYSEPPAVIKKISSMAKDTIRPLDVICPLVNSKSTYIGCHVIFN